MTWSLFVPGLPKSARPGTIIVSKTTGRPFLRKRNTAWAEHITQAAALARPKALLDGPLVATLAFTLLRPASVSAKQRPHPTKRPDVERLASGVLDALQGIVYADDAAIVDLRLRKWYGEAPGVRIVVEVFA